MNFHYNSWILIHLISAYPAIYKRLIFLLTRGDIFYNYIMMDTCCKWRYANMTEHANFTAREISLKYSCAYRLMHDDVIKWKHFPRYWPFVRGIHRSPVNSPHKGQWRGALIFSLIWHQVVFTRGYWINICWLLAAKSIMLNQNIEHRSVIHLKMSSVESWSCCFRLQCFISSLSGQNDCYFADDIFKRISMN